MTAARTPLGLEILQSVGPFIAAAVALYIASQSERRNRRQRPDLRLIFERDSDDFEAGLGAIHLQHHRVRLRVANRWGKRTAEDVEVLVVQIRPMPSAPSINGYALRWANAMTPDGSRVTRMNIPPGVARHVELLTVEAPAADWDNPSSVEGVTPVALRVNVYPEPTNPRFWLPEGTWQMLVALTAKDTDATYYGVQISHDGVWWGETQVKQHLRVFVGAAQYFSLEPEEAWARMLSRRDRLLIRLEFVRWMNPRNWKAMRALRRARRLYPGRSVSIDDAGNVTPLDDVLSAIEQERAGGASTPRPRQQEDGPDAPQP